jgi:hypothetical protein
MSAKQIILGVCVVLISINSAYAKSWRGLEPLHSTRADVARLFGRPIDDKYPYEWMYDFPEERAFIRFSSGDPCEEGLPGGLKVPKDIVVEIEIYPRAQKKMEEVLTAGKEYEEIRAAHTAHIYYFDSEEGVSFTVTADGLVQSISYSPSAKEKDYQCGEYKYAAPILPGVKLKKVELATLDSFGAISFIDAQARLDNLIIQLFQLNEKDPGWRAYIVVYAGRRSYIGEAQFMASCYKNYLVRVRKPDPESVIAVDGGFREEFEVYLYLGRADHYPPLLLPTVSPKKVQVNNRRLKSCDK